MRCTGLKKEDFSSDGICRIIETCGKQGVFEIHFGNVSVFFTPDRQMKTRESRRPMKQTSAGPLPVLQEPEFPHTVLEKETLAIEEERLKAEQYADLILTDPVAAERLAMENIGKDVGEEGIDENEY